MDCATDSCNNTTNGRSHCSTCRSRRSRSNNPFRYHYLNLKHNAKRRGKAFDLTLEEFRELWLRHPDKWEEKKGPGECKWQVDREDPTKGYTADNVQIMEKKKNVIKYQKHGRYRMETYWAEKQGQMALEEKAPF